MTEGTAGGRRVSQGLLVDTTDQKRLEAAAPPRRPPRSADRARQPGALPRPRRAGPREPTPAAGRRSRCCSSTSTTSRSSTTRSATGPATGCSSRSPIAWPATIRAGDVAARQGGDEFTVLLDQLDGVDERSRRPSAWPPSCAGRSSSRAVRSSIGVSVGIALAERRDRGRRPARPRRRRDVRGQGQGKARHAVFDPSMRVRARSRLEMEAELRTAIERGAVRAPLPADHRAGDRPDRRLRGARPLAPSGSRARPAERLHPAGRGDRPDRAARPARHDLGLPPAAGAARRGAGTRRRLTMSVNVSPRQAVEPGFAAEIAAILACDRSRSRRPWSSRSPSR